LKSILIIIFLVLNTIVSATDYYISSSGDDTNNGLSSSTPWKTITKVNSVTFSAGDNILFNRGDTWRESLIANSGSASGFITYGAYGTGPKPKLLGSVTANNGWIDLGSNIWQHTGFAADVGNLIFNDEKSCGVKIMSITPTLDTQGEFWYDFVNHLIKIYSVGNPATFYTNIECVLRGVIIDINLKSYAIIENLDLRYGNFGIQGETTDHIIIRNCDLSYIGGCDQLSNYSVRFGNGIEFWESASNVIVEKCRIDNVYDAALTSQGKSGGRTVSNLSFRSNIISNSEYSWEYWLGDETTTANNIYFEHNTCINAGGGFGHNQRPDGPNGRHLMIYSNTAKTNNVYIRNNIFSNATESIIFFSQLTDISDVIIDYNDFYQSSGYIGRIASSNYNTLARWRASSGQDAHSISANPIFVGARDYHLQATSPAIGTGIGVGLTTDYDGNTYNDPPSIGAYEHYLSVLPGNQPPVVTISNPRKGDKYENLATITIDAIASDPDGTVIKVEFYSGSEKLAKLTTAPYSYAWKDVEPGTYSITAFATDNLNATTSSSPVEFVVGLNIKYDANS